MNKYRIKRCREHTFFFKKEPDAADILHIYARHLTSETDAVVAFFTGKTQWNAKHQRFETTDQNHTLYWFWLDETAKKVMVITCFRV